LRAALDSVASQTFRDFQLIIVDDGSTDDSTRIIHEWIEGQGSPCTLIEHQSRRGICRSANEALHVAEGEFWAGLASDDMWEPRFLESFVSRMRHQPDEVALVYGDVSLIDEEGHELAGTLNNGFLRRSVAPEGWVFDQLWLLNFIPAMAALCRTQYIRDVGGYDESLWFEDWDLWLRLASLHPIAFNDEILARRRIVGGSMSSSPAGQRRMAESRRLIRSKWIEAMMQRVEAGEVGLLWPSAGEDCYSAGLENAGHLCRVCYRHQPSIRNAVIMACASARLPYEYFRTSKRIAAAGRDSMRALLGHRPVGARKRKSG
jgi:glycosyltransferase involved in cell wall biosynthesis